MDAETVIQQLCRTARVLSKSLNQHLDGTGIFSSEWTILTMLRQHGTMLQIELAKLLDVEAPAISKSLLKLEQKGYICRETGTSRREKKVSLTQEALSEYKNWQKKANTHHEIVMDGLSDKEIESLSQTLNKIFSNATQE